MSSKRSYPEEIADALGRAKTENEAIAALRVWWRERPEPNERGRFALDPILHSLECVGVAEASRGRMVVVGYIADLFRQRHREIIQEPNLLDLVLFQVCGSRDAKPEVVRSLCEAGADPNWRHVGHSEVALGRAIGQDVRNWAVAKVLLEFGATQGRMFYFTDEPEFDESDKFGWLEKYEAWAKRWDMTPAWQRDLGAYDPQLSLDDLAKRGPYWIGQEQGVQVNFNE